MQCQTPLQKNGGPVSIDVAMTGAANLRGRSVLMICASRDEIVPPSAGKALWEELGRPKIVWYDTTHYGAALYFVPALQQLVEHFGAE